MALTLSNVNAEIGWTQTKTNTGYGSIKQGPDKLTATLAPAVATYNELLAVQGTLAASASTTIDLYSITNLFGESKTLTKGIALMVKATTTGMKIEPGASNPLTWFWGGTSPSITIKAGGFILLGDGGTATISATDRNLKITNTSGSTTGTYDLVFLGGT